MDVGELAGLVAAVATLVTALTAMVVQLRRFRSEIVSAVERHLELTRENRALLIQLNSRELANKGPAELES